MMSRDLHHYAPATPVLVLALLVALMSLPSRPNHFFSLTRAKASIDTTFTVNSIGDGADSNLADGVCNDGTGACTLRAAIQEANTAATDDAITFSATLNRSIITLNSALPDINGNLNITGPGASLVTVQRNFAVGTPRFRIFTNAGPAGTMNLSGLTISNGHTADGTAGGNGDNGGAILNSFGSTLNLTNVVISGSVTGDGDTNGGLGGYGGGIFNNGTVTLSNSSVTGNRTGNGPAPAGVGGAGGGIYNIGTLTITNSSVSDNLTGNGLNGSGDGGGISSGGVLTINSSTIGGNQTGSSGTSGGGGIWAANTLTLANSTISGNQANAYGGGLAAFGDATLTNVTITSNRGGNFGGGLYRNSGTVTLQSTVVAGNFQGASPSTTADDVSGTVDANSSFNLIGTGGSGGLTNGINNNQVGVADPRLGPLANNGGPTPTHALLSGSVAIDAGNSLLTTDQRGQPRPVDDPTVVNAAGGNASDIGAYEAHSLEVNSIADADDGLCRPLGTGNGCTLREAINAANAEFGAELVTFAPALTSGGPATINLLTGLSNLSTDMTLSGTGANLLTVQRSAAMGTPAFRIFTTTIGTTVTISGLTISNGKTADGVPAPVFGNPGGHGGGILNAGTLTLNDDVITGNTTGKGAAASSPSGSGTSFGGPGGSGGAVFSSGSLTMSNVTIANNTTGAGATDYFGGGGGSGAGIYLNSGSLTMTNCVVSGNITGRGGVGTTGGFSSGGGGSGAGIGINSGTATLNNVTLSNNTTGSADIATPANSGSGGNGGGISIETGNISIRNSTITGNLTGEGVGALGQGGFGGGIFHADGLHTGALTVTNSTISGNTTGVSTIGGGGVGGGVYTNGVATFTNSTISGNLTTGPGGWGGGFYSAATLTLTACTITGNRAFDNSNGNGIYAFSSYPPPILGNTVVAGNGTAGASDLTGPFNSQGHNLIGNADGSSGFNATDQFGSGSSLLDPRLGPLANNGGPTQTHALRAGSPALDAGDNALATAASLTTDQRGAGFVRIVDGPDSNSTDTVDIGAFEAQVSVADIGDQTINEDVSLSLPFNVGGAASITGVTATSSNPTLVPNSPANISISGSGSSRTLQINPVANGSGTATITVTVNGNNSQTMTDTFVLTVNPVNDVPSFSKGADQTVNENAGAQTVNGWASNISAGPANESGQTLTFVVTNNSNASLFAVGPAVSPTGTLTYTPATGASGTALITIALKDNGGTANGGVDTSAGQSFNLTVREGGALQFSAATFAKAEDGGTALITVNRTGGSAGEARVDYATSNGTATAGQDYTSASATLIFADGVTSQTFNVAISNDAVDEPDETINLTLTNAAGSGSLGTPATAVLTINDNDPLPGLAIDNPAVSEGNSGTTTVSFTVTLSGQSSQTVTVNYATANGTATAGSDYVAKSGTLTFLPLETSKSIPITVNGDINFEDNETFVVNLSNPVNATIGEGQGGALISNDDAQGGFIAFSQGLYTVSESGGFTTITVNRTNDLSGPATVQYFTRDYADSATTAPCNTVSDFASSRCDYTGASGTLRFAAGETTKTFIILVSQDNFEEDPESFSLTLSSPTDGALLGNPPTATVTITDDATEPPGNPLDSADAFVRQHYHDFLNREPDAAGLAFWSNQITECQQPGATCNAEVRRINVSAAFFLSIEFQETGYLAYRFYKSAYGNISGTPVPLRFSSEFLPDTQQLGKDVIIGQPGAEQRLEANKVAYALDFVTRTRFTTAYPTTLTPAQFVDALFTNAEVTPSATDRNAAINEFAGAGDTSDTAARARSLRLVAENSILKQQETNKAFVLMQYFGYLRRNPNDPPEIGLNFDGYNFWLAKLNQFNGNFVEAEMVKAFIVSGEYRKRFGE